MSTDLVTTSGSPANFFGGVALAEDVDPDEVRGLKPDMLRLGIPAGGITSWEIPGDDPERPDTVREIDCIIVHSHECSILWLTKLGEGDSGASPHAYSDDGINQVVTEEAIKLCDEKGWPHPSPILAQCPFNQPGSKKRYIDPSAHDYAFANTQQRRLYILREGQAVPDELTLATMSIKPWSNYLVSVGQVAWKYKTRISLKKIEKKYTYSIAQFQNLGMLPEEIVAQVRELKGLIKANVAGKAPAAPVASDFTPAPADDESIPF